MTTTTADIDASLQPDPAEVSITKQLEQSPPPNPLPTGWILRKSGRSGAYYYYHMETGISQWQAPAAMSAAAADAVTLSEPETATEHEKEDDTWALEKMEPHVALGANPAAPDTQAATATGKQILDETKKRPVEESPKAEEAPEPINSKRQKKPSIPSPKEVRVLHILKKHKDSRRPSSWRQKTITSTVEEAKAELQDLLDVLTESKDNPEELRATFSEIARTESDCSSAKRGGDLGFFGRRKMQPAFEEASFGLEIGKLSGIVETSSGVHVLLRVG